MTEPTDTDDIRPFSGTIYRYIMVFFMAVIIIISILILVELSTRRPVAFFCDNGNRAALMSDNGIRMIGGYC